MKKNKYKYVNLKDNIADILVKYPYVAESFLAFGLHCVGCFANSFDTLEGGSVIHGMTEEEIDEMLSEVNYVIEQNEKINKKSKDS